MTICTQGRFCWFGEVIEGRMVLSAEGRVIEEEWRKIPGIYPRVELDEWIVMPDHLHGILFFQNLPIQGLRHEIKTLQSQSAGTKPRMGWLTKRPNGASRKARMLSMRLPSSQLCKAGRWLEL